MSETKEVEVIDIMINPAESQPMLLSAANHLEMATEFEVCDNVTCELATRELQACKKFANELDAKRKELGKPLRDGLALINNFFNPALDELGAAERVYKDKIGDFMEKEEAKRIEAQRKAEEAARAERERLEAEARKAREEALQAKNAADAEAKLAEAQEKMVQSEMTAPVPVPSEAPKVKGVSRRKTYKAEVTDLKAFLQAVLDGTVPVDMVTVNTKELGKVARALGKNLTWPGVTVSEDKTMAVRS